MLVSILLLNVPAILLFEDLQKGHNPDKKIRNNKTRFFIMQFLIRNDLFFKLYSKNQQLRRFSREGECQKSAPADKPPWCNGPGD